MHVLCVFIPTFYMYVVFSIHKYKMAEKSKWVANLIVSFLNIEIFITGFCEWLRNEIFHGFFALLILNSDARCWDIGKFSFSHTILSFFHFSP